MCLWLGLHVLLMLVLCVDVSATCFVNVSVICIDDVNIYCCFSTF